MDDDGVNVKIDRGFSSSGIKKDYGDNRRTYGR